MGMSSHATDLPVYAKPSSFSTLQVKGKARKGIGNYLGGRVEEVTLAKRRK